jgi:hypothetical protein
MKTGITREWAESFLKIKLLIPWLSVKKFSWRFKSENWNLFGDLFFRTGTGKYQKNDTHPTLVWGPPRGPRTSEKGFRVQVSTMGEFGVPIGWRIWCTLVWQFRGVPHYPPPAPPTWPTRDPEFPRRVFAPLYLWHWLESTNENTS